MIFIVTAVTFVATVLMAAALVYGFSSAGGAAVGRLTRLWHPAALERPKRMRERQVERAGHVLEDLGKMLPEAKGKQASRLNRLLLQAGFRRPNSAAVFRGTKILLTALGVGAVYLSGYHRQNQMALLFALALGFVLPDLWLNRRVRQRKHRLRLSLPDALDLLVICVEAGLGLDQAILRVSQELRIVHPELSEEFRIVNLEMRIGKSRLDALRSLSERTGVDDIKALVAMLIQTERFGTSIAQSLRVHSDTLRIKRRQRAEEAAAKTPVKMVPVLVFFIVPALLVVILGPAVITLSRQLIPMMGGQ
jgi:tight adherence protein C